jgi:hypothetical protein
MKNKDLNVLTRKPSLDNNNDNKAIIKTTSPKTTSTMTITAETKQ